MRIVYNKHTVVLNCFLVFIFCFGSICTFGQSPYCGSNTPYFTVNLKDNADSLWLSSSVRRNDLCCGIDPNETPPVRCVQFGITLDSGAVGIIFNIVQGAVPPGALDYSIDCGIRGFPGEVLCLDGPWPKFLTFCKPGFNPNIYSIKSVPGPKITPPVIVSDGCTQTLSVTGLQLNTIKWTSVPSDPVLESYLNCTSACSTVVATYRPGAPDSVVYQASGIVVGNCNSKPAVLTTKVYFVNNKKVEIIPIHPIVCFGGNNTPITARPSGGKPPYSYLWSTGEKTQTIKVGEGFYEVTVQDGTSCPPTKDTVTVKSFKLPILALAGPDQKICNESKPIKVKLSGAVQATRTGLWKGSGGFFSPSDTSLNAIYTPSSLEIASGKSTIKLITTNIGDCIPHADSLAVTYPLPIPINVEDQTVCTGGNVLFQSTQFSTGTYSWLRNGTVVSTISNYSSIADSSFKIIVSYKSKDGCFSKDSALATVFFKPEIDISDQLVCEDKTVTISSNIINASLAPIAYSWFRNGLKMPDTTSSITTNIKGKYILAYSKGTCQVKDSAMLSFFPVKVNAGPDGVICRLATIGYKLNGTKQNSALVKWIGGSGSYIPSDTVLSPVYYPSVDESRTFSITLYLLSDANPGCKVARDSVKIMLRPEPLARTMGDTVCTGEKGKVRATLVPGLKYSWSDKSGNVVGNTNEYQYLANFNTPFHLSIKDSAGCIDTVTATIYVFPKPVLTVKDTIVCEGTVLKMKGTLKSNPILNAKYVWSGPGGFVYSGDTAIVLNPGVYTLKYGFGNCNTSTSNNITFAPKPLIDNPPTLVFCPENVPTVALDAGIYNGYKWFDGNSNKTINVSKGGLYFVKVYNQFKCESTKVFNVNELCSPRVFVPSAFTPGGANNQFFDVKEAYVEVFQLLIFNRWGEIIFESKNPYISWDGNYRGDPMPIGVYPWVVTYEGKEHFKGPYKLQGSVTVIR